MIKGTAFLAAAIAAGFAFGFMWGRGTRAGVSEATRTSFDGGVLTVQLDTGKALGSGLASIFR